VVSVVATDVGGVVLNELDLVLQWNMGSWMLFTGLLGAWLVAVSYSVSDDGTQIQVFTPANVDHFYNYNLLRCWPGVLFQLLDTSVYEFSGFGRAN
jgi:hypothetical protein